MVALSNEILPLDDTAPLKLDEPVAVMPPQSASMEIGPLPLPIVALAIEKPAARSVTAPLAASMSPALSVT